MSGFEFKPIEDVETEHSMRNFIKGGANIHGSVEMGHFNVIGKAKIGLGVRIGNGCVIEDGVEIGDNTVLMNHVELRKGTVIGEKCYIDSGVTCTGNAVIGNNVTLRNYVVVARGCVIGDGCFIAPRAMFNNLDHAGRAAGGARLGRDVFIGTQAVLGAGVDVCDGAVVGSCALVTKDITEKGVYVGIPAVRLK